MCKWLFFAHMQEYCTELQIIEYFMNDSRSEFINNEDNYMYYETEDSISKIDIFNKKCGRSFQNNNINQTVLFMLCFV